MRKQRGAEMGKQALRIVVQPLRINVQPPLLRCDSCGGTLQQRRLQEQFLLPGGGPISVLRSSFDTRPHDVETRRRRHAYPLVVSMNPPRRPALPLTVLCVSPGGSGPAAVEAGLQIPRVLGLRIAVEDHAVRRM